MTLFSEREGYKNISKLDPEVMPDKVRNRIWNSVKKFLNKNSNRNKVIENTWDRFFKEDIDNLNGKRVTGIGVVYNLKEIKLKFYNLKWFEVYDFIEFILKNLRGDTIGLKKKIEKIFEDEKVPYRIINKKITQISSKSEAREVEAVLENEDLSESKNHIKKALIHFSKNPNPDYCNSIKESISAIEALARNITGNEKGTLGDLVKSLNIHPAFKDGINSLYGWTSDEGGIRHAEKETEFVISKEEARYMLVTSSALVNYIISKEDK